MGVAGLGLAGYQAYQAHQAGQDARNAANRLTKASLAPYESGSIQRFLPPELRMGATGPIIGQGMEGIGNLIRNPGMLSSTVGASAAPEVAAASQDLASQYRDEGTNQAGAAGANNLPSSIKALLQAALGAKQAGAQRGVLTKGLGATDQAKRAGLEHTYKLLDTILQFISSGRGQTVPGLVGAAEQQGEAARLKQAASTAAIGSLLQSYGSGGGFGG